MGSDEPKPQLTRALLLRDLNYARPYWGHLGGMLFTILVGTGLSLLTPLIFRNLIDQVLPAKDVRRLVILSIVLVLIPILNSVLTVIQRRLNATIGEGVIFDLRSALFTHLQRMSLRFFTNTKVGELMSRLNDRRAQMRSPPSHITMIRPWHPT
jgi:ATP-binding cassette subfamily B protein